MRYRILRRVTAAFLAMALAATAIAAVGAQVPASPTGAGRAAPDDVLQLEIGEHSGRIEMLRPRGSSKADQPEWFKPIAAAASQFVPQNGIQYHGGPVMIAPKAVAIYWGNSVIFAGGPVPGTTGPAASDGSLIGYFMTNLGGTPYYNINTTYTDANGTPIPNALTYAGFWANNHNVKPECTNVSDQTIQNEIVWGSITARSPTTRTRSIRYSGPGRSTWAANSATARPSDRSSTAHTMARSAGTASASRTPSCPTTTRTRVRAPRSRVGGPRTGTRAQMPK